MAGTHPFLIKLRGVLRTLNDEALSALANKGLLRRAQKDLEAAKPTILAIDSAAIKLQVAEAEVTVPELPAKSACACPSTGICRHILAALVYLRDDPEVVAAEDAAVQGKLFEPGAADNVAETATIDQASAAGVLANVTEDELQRWAGKALLRKAAKTLAANPIVEIDTSKSLKVFFPSRNITCRWIPSGGLLGMVCSCQAEAVCEHVVAAVLAYQVSLGKRQLTSEESTLKESSGAPRNRAEVLAAVRTTLGDMISLGLARLSAATVQRLATLAVSAHGVDLPRLERLLKSLAEEIQLCLRRDAQSSSTSLLVRAAEIEALCVALGRQATGSFVGQHRTLYVDVGLIRLAGVGAQHWRSKSGYHGVTVYFWDESRSGWSTWSDARPVDQPGFSPAGRFRTDGPWVGCASPDEASNSTLQLSGAWRNAQGRLSGRGSTRALLTGKSDPLTLPTLITDWSQLVERARQYFSGGLRERDASDQFVLLAPDSWGAGFYDSLRQELIRPVYDAKRRAVELWLPFSAEQQAAVQLLERHDPQSTRAVFGSLALVAGTIRVQPISLYVDDTMVHLNLQQPPSAKPAHAVSSRPTPDRADIEDERTDEVPADLLQGAAATALGRLFSTAQAEVEAIAESGVATRRDRSLLHSATRRMENLGLTACSRSLRRLLELLDHPAQFDDPELRNRSAHCLLHAYYVLTLAADRDAVHTACGSFA